LPIFSRCVIRDVAPLKEENGNSLQAVVNLLKIKNSNEAKSKVSLSPGYLTIKKYDIKVETCNKHLQSRYNRSLQFKVPFCGFCLIKDHFMVKGTEQKYFLNSYTPKSTQIKRVRKTKTAIENKLCCAFMRLEKWKDFIYFQK